MISMQSTIHSHLVFHICPYWARGFLSHRGVGVGGGLLLFSNALWLLPIWRRDIQIISFYQWPIVQDTGVTTTCDKPGILTCSL